MPEHDCEFVTGAERIAAERQRQVEAEGWTPEHDAEHDTAEMVDAAIGYAELALRQVAYGKPPNPLLPLAWPWSDEWWKPSEYPIRNLEKAGALIAAEIDRLQRAAHLGRNEPS